MRGRELSYGERTSLDFLVSKQLSWIDHRESLGHLVKTQEAWRRSTDGNSYGNRDWMSDRPSTAWKRVPETTNSTTVIMQQQVTVISLREEVKLLLLLTFPITLIAMITHSMQLIDLFMLGHILSDSDALAVSALASLYFNVFWFFLTGAATIVDTYCSTAKGANSLEMATVWFQRSVLVLTIACIPIFVAFFMSEKAFLAIGQSPDLSKKAAEFVIRLAPGLWPATMSVLIVKYLVILDVLYMQVLFGTITVFMNVGLDYCF